MKTYFAPVLCVILGIAVVPVHGGTSTFQLNAGQLTSPASAPMQVDNTNSSPNGSLLLLIDIGPGNTINNTLSPGSYVSGANTILAAGGFNTGGGTNETFNLLLSQGITNPGDEIALRWFPQITYAQYQAGTVPAVGDYFGTYNPNGGSPDGGNAWVVPADGSTVQLFFFTTNSDGGGTQPPSAGFTSFQVSSSGTVSFSQWQSTYFSAQQLNEPAVSGPSATPEGDGVPNLLKYLFAINPSLPMTTADRAALPAMQLADNGTVLTLTYRESPTVTGVTVHAQDSTDLKNWSNISSQQISTDSNGNLIIQAQVALTASRQFLRLKVTSP